MIKAVFFSLAFFLFLVSPVSANTDVQISDNDSNAHSDVSVTTNTGNNTICVNGKCATTSNGSQGKSTVCINGKCTTSDDGDMDIENGNSKVHISNSDDTTNVTATTSPNPKFDKKMEDKKASIEAMKQEIKEKIQQKHFDFGQIIRGFSRLFLSWIF